MKKRISFILIALALCLVAFLTSCNGNNESNPFLGTWKGNINSYTTRTYVFESASVDETNDIGGIAGTGCTYTYSYTDSQLTLTVISSGSSYGNQTTYSYTINSTTLTLTDSDGTTYTYTKQ